MAPRLLFALFLLAACGGPPAPAVDCLPVSPEMIAAIAQGLTVDGGGTLDASTARAVRSADFERVYFIAAEIDGPGMEGAGEVGVWASNGLEPGAGLVFAVDGLANEFSDWGDGGATDARLTLESAGAREAAGCVRDAQR